MEPEQKRILYRIILSAVLLGVSFLGLSGPLKIILCLAAYLLCGGDVLWQAGKNIGRGKVFDEHFLMAIATLGALLIGEYPEAAAVMLFYQVGELFQDMAVEKSRASITALMDIRPDYANLETGGTLTRVSPDAVAAGSVIVVKPGEKIPLDGTVVAGNSTLDMAALTGESLPRDVMTGDEVLSGCVNLSGLLKIRTAGAYGDSTVARILALVEDAEQHKAPAEKFITRFARVYTPAVVAAAVLCAVIPALLTGDWLTWIRRALIFLVVSCPCALVVSIPLTFFSGVGGAARRGILVKGANYLEALARAEIMVFDKTGTLTHGNFAVTAVCPEGGSADELLELAALAERYSDHPIAQSLRAACRRELDAGRVGAVEELAGYGVKATVDGKTVYVGNQKLMAQIGCVCPNDAPGGAPVHVAVAGSYAGTIVIADTLKPQAAAAIAALKAAGVRRTVMLTGDRIAVAAQTAQELGLDDFRAELLPADKISELDRLAGAKSAGGRLAFVGDGVNDAPVLKQADIGIAMGALGSDAAIAAADVVLMDDDPAKIVTGIRIARKAMRIVRQNIVFALGVKLALLLLSAFGLATMWEAVFADVGVALLAILNALRALRLR